MFVAALGIFTGTIELVGRYRDAPFRALRTKGAFVYVAVNVVVALTGLFLLQTIGSYGMLFYMSKLLEQAIEKVRQLPEHEQDVAAAELIGYLDDFATSQERSAIAEGRQALERGDIVPLDQLRHDMELGTH